MKRLGANTVLVPGKYAECEKAAHVAAARQGKTFFSPYSDPAVIAGQGTVGLELAEQCPDLAAVFACVGGSGLIGGIGRRRIFAPMFCGDQRRLSRLGKL